MISIFMPNILFGLKMTDRNPHKQERTIDEVLHLMEQRKAAYEKLAKSINDFYERKKASNQQKHSDDEKHTSKK